MILSLAQPKKWHFIIMTVVLFAQKTRQVIDELSLHVGLKNIQHNHKHRIDLKQGGNKTQVPCLRIEQSNSDIQWLYESDDIINYLRSRK